MTSIFKKTELANGIKVVSEFHPQARSVSMGIWVLTGTRDEELGEEGLAHFLEHLVFKGTKNRSAYQIAKSLEALGGDLNAHTSRENTCYHAFVLKDHWERALDVLSDLVSNMSIDRHDFNLEKGVILQEIAMSEDSHEEFVYDLFFENVYGKNPMGRPILGTVKSITEMKQKDVLQFYKKNYTGKNLVISAAGNIDHQELVRSVEKKLGHKKKYNIKKHRTCPRWKRVRNIAEKTSDQTHMVLGLPTSGFKDRQRFESYIVNTLLGGGMTSRLYQAVREKRGLVYSIHSSINAHIDSGMLMVYAGAETKNIKKVGQVIVSELKKLKKQGVTQHEVDMYKTQVIGNILLGADDMENRMNSIAVNEMVFGKYKSIDNVIAEIQKVNAKSVNHFIESRIHLDLLSGAMVGADLSHLQDWWQSF